MRMLLISGGLEADAVRDSFLKLLGSQTSDARIAIVIDAILPFGGDHTHLLDDLDSVRRLGWRELDVISLLAAPRHVVEERLRSADAILCYGGSNHWLAHAWTSTGLAPLLRELLDEKVYVGWSAGSMIFSRRHNDVVDTFEAARSEIEMLQLSSVGPALPLVDWVLMPHLGASFFPWATDQWAADSASRLKAPVWFLDDASALLVTDPDAAPEVVSQGHWLRFDETGTLVASQ